MKHAQLMLDLRQATRTSGELVSFFAQGHASNQGNSNRGNFD
jgi:hypothetical protein